jgi:hypothetical protein
MINEKPVRPGDEALRWGARMTSGSANFDGTVIVVPYPGTEESTSGSGDKLALAGASES